MGTPKPKAEYPDIDPTTIAPCKTKGGIVQPDFVNNVPSRFVSREESEARGWSAYWDGSSCRIGHQAAKFISNSSMCTDCWRLKKGKPAIYPTAKHQEFYKPRAEKQAAGSAPLVVEQKPLEPTAADKRFLEALAQLKDFEAAATSCGTTTALIHSRLAYNAVFKAAVVDLQTRLQIKHVIPASAAFEWTDAKRARLIEVYIDTGSLADARDAIGATPSQYFAEKKNNSRFADQIEEADPLAAKALEDIATQLALRGQDKLLIKLLTAKIPTEYSERLKLDVTNNYATLTDEQLNERLRHALIKAHRQKNSIIDAVFTDLGKLPAPAENTGSSNTPAAEEPASASSGNDDLL
jgi:hypothetical protein